MTKYEDLEFNLDGGIAKIAINRPEKLNAFRQQTLDELEDAFRRLETMRGVGVVVLSGNGGRSFCAGGDIDDMGQLDPQAGLSFLGSAVRASRAIRDYAMPVIAKVQGYCLGGGNELQLFCDLTIATEDSVFGQTGLSVGSAPIWGGTQLLPRTVGEKRARELVFLCERYTAAEALAMGLINKVVASEDLDATVETWCQRILQFSPQALRIAKVSLNYGADTETPSFTHGRHLLAQAYGTEEFQYGMRTFKEKQPAEFDGFR